MQVLAEEVCVSVCVRVCACASGSMCLSLETERLGLPTPWGFALSCYLSFLATGDK